MNSVIQMKDEGWKDEGFSPVCILGIVLLVIGLLIAVGQFLFIGNEVNNLDQVELLASLCYIAMGMAVEFFGIGLIIHGSRK